MKTIKIFLASSEELKPEREMMASLANSLNTVLEKQGIQVIAVEWENLDASMGPLHKQEDYNIKLKECEMCMVLYWTKFGMYTKTELDTAFNELNMGNNPRKVYVYFKESDNPSEELKAFRDSFPTKYGHFYTPFANFDTLKAHFLLQFMEYLSQLTYSDEVINIQNGKVIVNGTEFVNLQNVPFAGNNDEYLEVMEELDELEEWFEEHDEDHPKYKIRLEKKNKLKKKIEDQEKCLWDTALTITRLGSIKCSERLERAIKMFESGNNKGANALLQESEIEKDAEHNVNLIVLGEEGKKGLSINIEELTLKLKLLRTGVDEKDYARLAEIESVLKSIIKYTSVLYGEYSIEVLRECRRVRFLRLPYKKQVPFFEKALNICNKLYGEINDDVTRAYRDLVRTNTFDSNYQDALKCQLEYTHRVLCQFTKNSPQYLSALWQLSASYENIDKDKSYSLLLEAVQLSKDLNDKETQERLSYTLINFYLDRGDKTSVKNLADEIIEEKKSTNDNLALLNTYIKLGREISRRYAFGSQFYEKALILAETIDVKEYLIDIYKGLQRFANKKHDTDGEIIYLKKLISLTDGQDYTYYIDLVYAYMSMSDFQGAEDAASKILSIAQEQEDSWSKRRGISTAYRLLNKIFEGQCEWQKAAECLQKRLEYVSTEDVNGNNGFEVSDTYYRMARLYWRLSEYTKASECINHGIDVDRKRNSTKCILDGLHMLGYTYFLMGKYDKAEEYYQKAINECESDILPNEWTNDRDIKRGIANKAIAYSRIAGFYDQIKEYSKAQHYMSLSYSYCKTSNTIGLLGRDTCQGTIYRHNKEYGKAIQIFESNKRKNENPVIYQELALTYLEMDEFQKAIDYAKQARDLDPDRATIYDTIGLIYEKTGKYKEALGNYQKCLKIQLQYKYVEYMIEQTRKRIDNLKETTQN